MIPHMKQKCPFLTLSPSAQSRSEWWLLLLLFAPVPPNASHFRSGYAREKFRRQRLLAEIDDF